MRAIIEKLDNLGRGICRIDNKVCFVPNALPDEIVELEIIKEKSKYFEGKLVKIIEPSSKRIKSPCPYFEKCGGCQYLHLSFDDEKQEKIKAAQEILSKFGDIHKNLENNYYSINKNNYRNKVVFHVKEKKLGFYNNISHDLVEIDYCLLLDDRINELIPFLKKLVEQNDIDQITVKVSNEGEEILLTINGSVKNYAEIANKVDVLIINNQVISTKKFITTSILNKKYLVGPNSFFQVNKYVSEKLYQKIVDIIKNMESKRVLDLYCGVGSIASSIASMVDNVVGVEISEEAVQNAIKSAKINSVTNTSFVAGKVEDNTDVFKENFDTLIVDPPRAGLNKNVINSILKSNIKNIIYISCDIATLARDLKILNNNYEIVEINMYDMFLHTYHCESISVLERK